MNTAELKSNGPSKIYRRATINTLKPTEDRSLRYWRAAARQIFEEYPTVELVECVTNGCKTSSQLVKRGCDVAPAGVYVIIASTGGKYGKSRREYRSGQDRSKTTMERLDAEAEAEAKERIERDAFQDRVERALPRDLQGNIGKTWAAVGPDLLEATFAFEKEIVKHVPGNWSCYILRLNTVVVRLQK